MEISKEYSEKISILGIDIDNLNISQANKAIEDIVSKSGKSTHYVVKPYVDFMVKAKKDSNIKNILRNADLVLPDGVSLLWAASYLYGDPSRAFLKTLRSLLFWIQKPTWRNQILRESLGGPNQTIPLLRIAETNNWRVGVLGGKPNEIDTRRSNLLKMFPGMKDVYCWHGYFGSNENIKLLDEIRNKKLDILFVAMGFPRQEEFIYTNRKENLAKVLIGEGGTFDYNQLGGNAKRAPKRIQKLGLEWLWRMAVQPKRIVRLYSVFKFIILIKQTSREAKI
jgi:N-acetylglucosaminyldiphosphoundecaprenol N-acetyl-beta-D-mannosaminyltransferase